MGLLFKILSALGITLFLMLTTKLLKLTCVEITDDRLKWFTQSLNTLYNVQSILQFISCLVMQMLLLNLFSSLSIEIIRVDSIAMPILSILICVIIGICAQLSLKSKFRNLYL